MPSQNIQQYIRIFIYYVAGWLSVQGVMEESMAMMIAGIASTGATLAWTMFGNRLVALLQRVEEYEEVRKVVVSTNAALANPAIVNSTSEKVETTSGAKTI